MFMTQCQENFMSDPILLTSEQGNIGIVTLNMAHKRNALNEDPSPLSTPISRRCPATSGPSS